MGHSSSSVSGSCRTSALNRHKRVVERAAKRKRCLEEEFNKVAESLSYRDENSVPLRCTTTSAQPEQEKENTPTRTSSSVETETYLTMFALGKLEEESKLLKSSNASLTKASFENNDEKVRFYTGLTTMNLTVTKVLTNSERRKIFE